MKRGGAPRRGKREGPLTKQSCIGPVLWGDVGSEKKSHVRQTGGRQFQDFSGCHSVLSPLD